MSYDQEKLDLIFSEALARASVEERQRYLEEACGADADLRRAMESLIAAHEESGDFLRQPVMSAGQGGPESDGPGALLGRYKLLQQIGQGGFGVVFMAEQQEPVRRLVALKIIKAGMDSKEVVARFEAERQALAVMDHPNIARVLDGGTTAQGRPYFVMDLVKGVPITEFCDQNRLPTEARLRLFLQVCAGVQHAHQKGIIHRDLKPSNVLVTVLEGEPLPKIIDFGIAKAIGQKLTDRTLFTRFEQLIGTPAYMSPEQAQWGGIDIDTRSDIYSLGVLLYELLTGTTPFEKDTLARAALDEVRRMIREKEPPTPSLRLQGLGQRLQDIAGQRQAEPAALTRLIRGELDWIVMKALEKDRARRYETASELALDLQRYLAGELVLARAPSNLQRMRKTIRKHRLAVGAGALVLASLMAGLTASLWMFMTERQAKREELALRRLADSREEQARAKAVTAQKLAQVFEDMLQGAGPEVAKGRDITILREILDRTALQVRTTLTNEPAVQAEVLLTVADVYDELLLYPQMEAIARADATIATNAFGEHSLAYADALGRIGRALYRMGSLPQSEACLRKALALRAELAPNDPVATADLRDRLGIVLTDRGEWDQAESIFRELLSLSNTGLDRAELLNNLALVLKRKGQLAEAEKLQRQAVVLDQKTHPETQDLAVELQNLGTQLSQQQRWSEAESFDRQALELSRKLWGPDNEKLAMTALSLVDVLGREKKYADAEAVFHQLLDPAQPPGPKDADLLAGWADFLARRGLWKQAVTNLCAAIRLQPSKPWRYSTLADVLASAGEVSAYRLIESQRAASTAPTPFQFLGHRAGSADWQIIEDTRAAPGFNARALAIAADSAGRLYCGGWERVDSKGRQGAVTRVSVDSGKTWSTLDRWVPGLWQFADCQGLCVTSNRVLFSAGMVQDKNSNAATIDWCVRRSTDGGATWTVQDLVHSGVGGKAQCHDVRVAPNGEIYAAGITATNQGAGGWVWLVRKSSDGGDTWKTVDLVWDHALKAAQAIGFSPKGSVFVAGMMRGSFGLQNGEVWTVRRSTDQGTSWQTVDSYQGAADMPAEAHGIAVDSRGTIYVAGMAKGQDKEGRMTDLWVVRRSTDDGATWAVADDFTLDARPATEFWPISGPTAITVTPAGTVVVAGYMTALDHSFHWLVREGRPGANAGLSWENIDNYQMVPGQSARANGIFCDPHGTIYVAGRAADAAGNDHWIIRRLESEPESPGHHSDAVKKDF